MLRDLKDFINKGSFVDIAVAFVIGAAFASVVGAFTGRIVTPLIAMLFNMEGMENIGTFGGVDENGAPIGSFGAFLEAALNFLVVGFVMFLVVKAYNSFKARNAEPDPETVTEDAEDIVLLRQIRDSLAR